MTQFENIGSAKVPQRNVEGLEEAIQTLAENGLKTVDKINDTKLNLDVFTASQSKINIKQSDFNISILEYINKIRALLIALHIMVLGLFIFDLGVVWYIIKH
jgi:hypothetical protein